MKGVRFMALVERAVCSPAIRQQTAVKTDATQKAVAILYIDNTSTFGGAINSLAHLLRGLDKTRFTPIVVSGQSAEFYARCFTGCICYHLSPKLSWMRNRIYRYLSALPPFQRPTPRRILHLLRYGYWLLCIYLPEGIRYYRIGRRHRVALVHLNNILGSQLPGIIAAKLLRVPCVAHLRDFEEVHPLTRGYARLIDHHLAISTAIRNNLLQLNVPSERISLVHDSIDLDAVQSAIDCRPLLLEFGLAPATPRFGIFGRVVNWKGIREFICGAHYVLTQQPDARAFVIGDTSAENAGYLAEMKQLAVDLGIGDRVIFTGYRRDVTALMQLMDVVVHASIRPEPFGMVLIEGMALAKPVVATSGGGPLEIVVNGETGLLVDMGDSAALGRAVLTLLQQPQWAKQMGQAGRRRVEALFCNQHSAAKVEEIYTRLSRCLSRPTDGKTGRAESYGLDAAEGTTPRVRRSRRLIG